jgi:putative spermidine/putrescine transport system permease protein
MGELEAVLSGGASGAGRGGPAPAGAKPEGSGAAGRPRIGADPHLLLVLPSALLLLVCFAYPVLSLLARSLLEPQLGLQNYRALAAQPLFLKVLWNTAEISLSVDFFCLLIGYPVAYTMASAAPRLRRLLIFVILIPFWTSILVRSFAWMVLLQKQGLVNGMLVGIGLLHAPVQLVYNRIGVLVGMVQILLPFMIFPLYSTMSRIDPIYGEAAATLGAAPMRNFLRVHLPLSLPGVLTGGVLVFVIALGYYITPALLGGLGDTMVAQLIEQEVADFGRWGLAGALSATLLAATAITLALILRGYSLRSVWKR